MHLFFTFKLSSKWAPGIPFLDERSQSHLLDAPIVENFAGLFGEKGKTGLRGFISLYIYIYIFVGSRGSRK